MLKYACRSRAQRRHLGFEVTNTVISSSKVFFNYSGYDYNRRWEKCTGEIVRTVDVERDCRISIFCSTPPEPGKN